MKLRVGTRGSALALRQTELVCALLREKDREVSIEIVPITTAGDRLVEVKLSRFGRKGLFTKEIEEALLEKRIDVAVHSLKDLPSESPPGLCLAAFPKREDPRDMLVSRSGLDFEKLPKGAVVGTGSLRRRAQLLAWRPDIEVRPLRGNIDTRLQKLTYERLDAIILAVAGVQRLGKKLHKFQYLPPEKMVPAVGQGALALQCREGETAILEKVRLLNDPTTELSVRAERAVMMRLGGGCHLPMAAHAVVRDDLLELVGFVGSLDGQRVVREKIQGSVEEWEELGRGLSEKMLRHGADKILEEFCA